MDTVTLLKSLNGFNSFLVQAQSARSEKVLEKFAQDRRGKLPSLECPVEGVDQCPNNLSLFLLDAQRAV